MTGATSAVPAQAAASVPTKRVWRARRMKEWQWRVLFAAAVAALVAGGGVKLPAPPRRKRGEAERMFKQRLRRWERRAEAAGLKWPDSITYCGKTWAVRVCPDCGRVDLRSARRVASCGRRFCPLCARRRATLAAAKLLPRIREIAAAGVQDVMLVTFTTRVAVDDPEAYTPKAIRHRAEAMARAAKDFVEFVRATDLDLGMHVRPDVGLGGNYHLHAILAALRFSWKVAQARYRAVLARAGLDGNLDFKVVHRAGDDVSPETIADAVAEVCKYIGKAPAAWRKVEVHAAEVDDGTGEVVAEERVGVEGGEGEVIDPELAALHEVALYAMNLNRWYGSFHNLKPPDDVDALNSDEAVGGDGPPAPATVAPKEAPTAAPSEDGTGDDDTEVAASTASADLHAGDDPPPTCPCGSYEPQPFVYYGNQDYDTSRCIPDSELEDRLDRARLAAGRRRRVMERWGVSSERLFLAWLDDLKRSRHVPAWLVPGRLRTMFHDWVVARYRAGFDRTGLDDDDDDGLDDSWIEAPDPDEATFDRWTAEERAHWAAEFAGYDRPEDCPDDSAEEES